jgi:uncharacterized protein with FMN-binding domain
MNQTNSNTHAPKCKKRLGWLISLVILLVLGTVGTVAMIADAPSRQELQALVIDDVNFSVLKDGVYTGSYSGTKGSKRDATVEVTILHGEVASIRTLKGAVDETGDPLDLGDGVTIDTLFAAVLDHQSLQVDTISGATLTSKAHLKALETALLQAQCKQP